MRPWQGLRGVLVCFIFGFWRERIDALPEPAKHWCSTGAPWKDCATAGGLRMMEELPDIPVPMPHWWESMQPYKRVCPSCEPIWLLCPVEDTGAWNGGSVLRLSSRMMLEKINSQQWLLPGYELMCEFINNDCNSGTAQKILLWSHLNRRNYYVGVGSTGCSGSSNVLSKVTWALNLPIVSWASGAPDLSVRSIHRNFFRTVIPHTAFTFAWISIYKTCGWKKIVLIMAEEARFRGHFELHKAETIKVGIEVAYEYQILQPLTQCDAVMFTIKSRRWRIVQILTFETTWRALMCSGYSQGVRGIVWFVLGVYSRGFYKILDNPDLSQWKCGESELRIMADNAIHAQTFMWSRTPTVPLACDRDSAMTPQSFKDAITKQFKDELDWTTIDARGGHAPKYAYAPAAADGACLFAQSLSVLMGLHPGGRRLPSGKSYSVKELQSGDLYEIFNQVMQNWSFNGVGSSPLRFNCEGLPTNGAACDDTCRNSKSCTGDLSGPVEVYQFYQHGQLGVHDTLVQGTMFPRRAVFDASLGEGKAFKWYSALRFGHGSYLGGSVGSLNTSNTTCAAGYEKVPGTQYCVPNDEFPICPPGKQLVGEFCESCPPNTFHDQLAGICRGCFLGQYQLEEGRTQCELCPKGTFINASFKTCVPCASGTVSKTPGSVSCSNCPAGQFSVGGSDRCIFCQRGRFAAKEAQGECTACLGGFTTKDIASTNSSACVCPKDSYLPANGSKCKGCQEFPPESVICEGFGSPPILRPGFMTLSGSSSVYTCAEPAAQISCLGGVPVGVENCPPHSSGIACTLCDDGYRFDPEQGACHQCEDYISWLIFVGAVVASLGFFQILRPTESTVGSKTLEKRLKHAFTHTPVTQVLEVIQFLGILGKTGMPWSSESRSVLFTFQGLTSFAMLECISPALGGVGKEKGVTQVYLINLVPALIVLFAMLAVIPSCCSARARSWLFPNRVTAFRVTIGILSTFFTSILNAAINLVFARYQHPSLGVNSLKAFPYLLNTDYQVFEVELDAVLSIVLWCGGYFLVVFILIYLVETNKAGPFVRGASISMVVKFRMRLSWFNLEILANKAALAVGPTVSYSPALQCQWLAFAAVVHLFLVMMFQPFRYDQHNVGEIVFAAFKVAINLAAMSSFEDNDPTDPTVTILLFMLAVWSCFYLAWGLWDYKHGKALHMSEPHPFVEQMQEKILNAFPGQSLEVFLDEGDASEDLRGSIITNERKSVSVRSSRSSLSQDDSNSKTMSMDTASCEEDQTDRDGCPDSAHLIGKSGDKALLQDRWSIVAGGSEFIYKWPVLKDGAFNGSQASPKYEKISGNVEGDEITWTFPSGLTCKGILNESKDRIAGEYFSEGGQKIGNFSGAKLEKQESPSEVGPSRESTTGPPRENRHELQESKWSREKTPVDNGVEDAIEKFLDESKEGSIDDPSSMQTTTQWV